MKHVTTLASLALLLAAVSGCVKYKMKVAVKNDASGTMTVEQGYNEDSMTSMAEWLSQMAGQGIDFGGQDPLEQIEKLPEQFTEAKLTEELKEMGLKVESVKATAEGAWRMVTGNGAFADVNALLAGMEKRTAAATDGGDMPPEAQEVMAALGGGKITPGFFKTGQPGVGMVRIIPALGDMIPPDAMGRIDEMDEMERQMIEGMLDMMKSRFGISDAELGVEIELPGNVVSTKGCKKKGDKTIEFVLRGSAIGLDGIPNLFGLKDGVSATFQIPEGCKIKFNDPTSKKTAKTEKPGQDDKPKGGLRVKPDDGGK